jgi:hypothetical protein
MRENRLFLASFEPETAYSPREIKLLRRVVCGERVDCFWAKVIPPFEVATFGLSEPTEEVLVAPRHAGERLPAASKSPVHVYVCIPNSGEILRAAEINVSEVRIVNWGIIYSSIDDLHQRRL